MVEVTPAERRRLLWRLSDLVKAHADELAVLETLDNPKPMREARLMDIGNAIQTLRYRAGWATKLNGETVSVSHPGQWHSYTLRQLFAVAGLVVPWAGLKAKTVRINDGEFQALGLRKGIGPGGGGSHTESKSVMVAL